MGVLCFIAGVSRGPFVSSRLSFLSMYASACLHASGFIPRTLRRRNEFMERTWGSWYPNLEL